MASVKGKTKGKAMVRPAHAYKKGESKKDYFARLSNLPKTVFGKGGSDAWFHFDELYEDVNGNTADVDIS